MARKTKTEQNKEKAAKQKKIAIAGGVVFVLLLAIQVPRTMKMMSGHPKPPVVSSTAADGTTTTTAAAPADPNSLAAPTLAGAPTTTTTAADTSSLVASVPLKVDPGQLENFQRFVAKDPFQAQVGTDGQPVGSSRSSSSGSSKRSASTKPSGATTAPVASTPRSTPPSTQPSAPPPAPAPTTGVISLNGTLMSVAVNTDFPSTAPVFHLISLTATTAKLGIAGGSYADGSQAITLKLKTPVTLQNTADGTKYTLILEPPSTPVTPGTSTTPASTPPASVPAVPSGTGG
jgi:hypothetical protein